MAHEVFHGSDLRMILSPLEQTALGTRLTDINLGAGISLRPEAPIMPEIILNKIGEGPRAFQGSEYPAQENERIATRDLRIPLTFRSVESFLIGYLGAFCLANVNSVQEATTTHYTHTIRPRDPLLATGRQARLTTLYFEATGPDASRRKAAYPDLTVLSFTLTVRPGEFIALAADFIGSGREDAAAAPTIPALASAFEIDSQQILIELGDQGGALTDISERLRELTITVNQVIDEAGRYRPTGGALANARFAARMPFLRRTASISIALGADRANTDIKDRVLNEQRSHIKITGDSGVLAGTGTVNHKFVFNVPDCRLREAPLEFDDSGAFYRVAIPETSMFPDSGIGNVPFELVVDNTQVSYFV